MIKLIKWLIFGHVHKWKTIEMGSLDIVDHDNGGRVTARGKRAITVCEHCGEYKKWDLA